MRLYFSIGLVLMSAPGTAQSQPARSAPPVMASVPAARLALARLVAVAAGMGTSMDSIRRAIPLPANATAASQQRNDVVIAWTAKYLPPDTVLAISARSLANQFTDEDLRGLLAFYKSPLGKKYAGAKPAIARQTSDETGRIMSLHNDELRAALEKASATFRPH